jgi:hypothetical protein
MTHFKHAVSWMIILALTLTFIACATAPVAEKSAAKAAMDTAVSSGADRYAAADLDAAKKIWGAAEDRMKEEKYAEAKQDYVAAKAAFDKVAGMAETNKTVATAEAKSAIASLERDWKNLKINARGVEKMMKDKEMKDDWAALNKSFTEDLNAIKDKIVSDPVVAKANADELEDILERWDKAFKELAASASPRKTTEKKAKPTRKKRKQ